MPETPYCPLLSINKEVPVLCQEELCMWYVKQLKLCSITVLAYTNAINFQGPQATSSQTPQATRPQQAATSPEQIKQPLIKEQPKGQKQVNPFALDDLD
jgi:hypothetical protein